MFFSQHRTMDVGAIPVQFPYKGGYSRNAPHLTQGAPVVASIPVDGSRPPTTINHITASSCPSQLYNVVTSREVAVHNVKIK